MNTLDAIRARRSIRKFKSDPLPDEALQAILTAAVPAPSGKNRQPWHFVVVQGDKRADMVRIMREGIAQAKARRKRRQQRRVSRRDGTSARDRFHP